MAEVSLVQENDPSNDVTIDNPDKIISHDDINLFISGIINNIVDNVIDKQSAADLDNFNVNDCHICHGVLVDDCFLVIPNDSRRYHPNCYHQVHNVVSANYIHNDKETTCRVSFILPIDKLDESNSVIEDEDEDKEKSISTYNQNIPYYETPIYNSSTDIEIGIKKETNLLYSNRLFNGAKVLAGLLALAILSVIIFILVKHFT